MLIDAAWAAAGVRALRVAEWGGVALYISRFATSWHRGAPCRQLTFFADTISEEMTMAGIVTILLSARSFISARHDGIATLLMIRC